MAACGAALVQLPQFSLKPLADALGWPQQVVERLFVYFLGLHDLGKFAWAFQGLAPGLSDALVCVDKAPPYLKRHDTLGWFLWRSIRHELTGIALPQPTHPFWTYWVRAVVGHHGLPPEESSNLEMDGGDPAYPHYRPSDKQAAQEFIVALNWLLPADIPKPAREHVDAIRQYSWQLAGLAVLADWLGSNQYAFAYHDRPQALEGYWNDVAMHAAPRVVANAGLATQPIKHRAQPLELFDYLREPTPLQRWAADVPLQHGPQLFVFEDVTGAGKTEAALTLTQRLMQAGLARGLYFALPSMATANQMYERVGHVYQRLFDKHATPSLMLAHGARKLVDGFRASVLQSQAQVADRSYARDEPSASAQCNAWLASHQKLALLTDVGVGTIDQALLGILPLRHQALRLAGLASKVLVVDEVHANDAYLHGLLQSLLTAHAAQGGSAVLLSATMPIKMRDELLRAYAKGRHTQASTLMNERRYPLAVQAGSETLCASFDTRPTLRRRVLVQTIHDENAVMDLVLNAAKTGRAVCWIRNTVSQARRAFAALKERGASHRTMLFHSRFAMGDRLAIEDEVLRCFGKSGTVEERAGRILVATQVVEQSLDLDFDVLISDLAPIDCLIQRAGRLWRHTRDAHGRLIDAAADGREGQPTLFVYAPPWTESPDHHWYSSVLSTANLVYPDTYRLWLTQQALQQAGAIVTPGAENAPDSVRELVESVYGPSLADAPSGLQRSHNEASGAEYGKRAQASFNAVDWDKGYMRAESAHWDDRGLVTTRLGETTREFVLTELVDGELRPLCNEGEFAWELSTVRIASYRFTETAPDERQRYAALIEALPCVMSGRCDANSILPLMATDDGRWTGFAVKEQGKRVAVHYTRTLGLETHPA